jgi:hypothetical protein
MVAFVLLWAKTGRAVLQKKKQIKVADRGEHRNTAFSSEVLLLPLFSFIMAYPLKNAKGRRKLASAQI